MSTASLRRSRQEKSGEPGRPAHDELLTRPVREDPQLRLLAVQLLSLLKLASGILASKSQNFDTS